MSFNLPAPHPGTEPNASDGLRRDLRKITLAWAFGCTWLWIAAGATMYRFAREVGTPEWAFGLLAAIPFVAALAQLPMSWWIQRHGGRRRLFLVCATAGRGLFVAIGLVPWVLPQESWIGWWPAVVVMLLLAHGLMQSTGPAWLNWMSDLIPRRVRGRYFARRSQLVTPVAVVASLGSAWLLDWADARESADMMLRVTSALLVFAGVLGSIDILIFLGIADKHENVDVEEQAGTRSLAQLLAPLRGSGYRHFLGFNFCFTLATGFLGQYLWLYLLEHLGWSNLLANALLLALPMVLQMLTRPAWGRLCDRLGKRPVLLIAGGFTAFGAVGWLMMTPTLWWPGYLLIVLITMMWPGLELANFNFLLDFTKSRKNNRRDEAGAGPSAAALFSICTAVAGSLSGVIGGAVAAGLGDWTWDTGLGDYAWNYLHVLLVLSTLIRMAALCFASGLQEPKATGTRDAMRYMTTGLFNNVRGVAASPGRLAGPVLRWGYRIDKRKRG
ncbi:MAG: MFS transporter [Planctomycetota bacterium]